MKERNQDSLYSLNKRGLALVFNQEHNRPGSNVDMAKLLPCLGKFFEVNPYWNLDAFQTKDTIEKFKETGMDKYSSLIIISMSHGGKDGYLEVGNGTGMHIDDLVKPFNPMQTIYHNYCVFLRCGSISCNQCVSHTGVFAPIYKKKEL